MDSNSNEITKILNDAIYKSVNKILEEKLKGFSFNYCVEGQVQQINKDDTYSVLINGQVQKVYTMNNDTYNRGDVVYILILNNNYSNKYILTKKSIKII